MPHAVCDAGVWPHDVCEDLATWRLLRSVGSAMLLTWDHGLHSFDVIVATRAQAAQFLGQLPANVTPEVVRTLRNGTQPVRLSLSDRARRRAAAPVRMRGITYTLDEPDRPEHGEVHRLFTSLLNPRVAPAPALVGVLHEIYGLLLALCLARAVLDEAAATAPTPLPSTRLSFLNTLRLVRTAVPEFHRTAPADHSRLYCRLLADIVATPVPPRRNHRNSRVVKHKMAGFRVECPAHRHWPQPTKAFPDAIVLA